MIEEYSNLNEIYLFVMKTVTQTQKNILIVDERIDQAKKKNKEIIHRLDDRLQNLLYRQSEQLTTFEKQYHRHLKDLQSWFKVQGEPSLEKVCLF